MFRCLLGQIKLNSVLKPLPTMKRITKDRTARKLTSASKQPTSLVVDTGESVEKPKPQRKTRAKTKPLPAEITSPSNSTTVPIKNEIPEEKGAILSKFKAAGKPKLGNKRPHLLVEYEDSHQTSASEINIKEEPQEIKKEDLDVTLKIKQEPDESDSSASSIKIVKEEDVDVILKIEQGSDESDSSASPIKMVKLEGINNIKTESKPPPNWKRMLENLRQMRKDRNAPVDLMGCDMCMDKTSNPQDARYQALISLMLSTMTRDCFTYRAMQQLHAYGCTVDKMLEVSEQHLAEMISQVNYRFKKVKYIKEATKMIKEEFGGDIPKTVKDLCRLKGVGPKMAHLCMKTAWDEVTGIGVDTHVHRISNRIGWVQSKNPEGTRKQLEGWLPQDLWQEVNHLLVGFGQQICQPLRPQCATCLNKDICPFGIAQLKKK